jgi:hypothetical protein
VTGDCLPFTHSFTAFTLGGIRISPRVKIVRLPEMIGAHGVLVVKALCYNPEGRGFDTQ